MAINQRKYRNLESVKNLSFVKLLLYEINKQQNIYKIHSTSLIFFIYSATSPLIFSMTTKN